MMKGGAAMNPAKTATAVWLLVLVCSFSCAYPLGETGAQFLKLGVGARACAMGEAYSGISDDATAIYWNPAGLTQISSPEITVMQNLWLMDMSYQFVAAAYPSPHGSMAAAISYSSSGDIPKYEDFVKVGEYSASDLAGALAYANRLGSGVSYGLEVKLVQTKIEDEAATGFAADLGLLYKLNNPPGMTLGLVVQHLGPAIKFIKQSDPLPRCIRVGAGYARGPARLGLDVNKPVDDDVRVGIGGEVLIKSVLALRAGYNSANTYTAGAGFNWHNIAVGYAFVPYEDIDNTHRISVTIRF